MTDHSSFERGFVSSSRRLALAAGILFVASASAWASGAVPVISSVHGCSDSSIGTESCATAGSIPITIIGSSFVLGGSMPSAFVGGRDCPVTSASETEIECTLPSGSGRDLDVVVTNDIGAPSFPARLLSYSPPSISSVGGCTDDGTGSTTSCARNGGTYLTIQGSNFGPSGASKSVVTGGVSCPVYTDTDDEIVCTLPPGTGTDKRVLVIAANQLSADVSYSFSYAQCAPGTYASGNGQCTACDSTHFSSASDAPKCEACPAGAVVSGDRTSCVGADAFQCYQVKDASDSKLDSRVITFADEWSNSRSEVKKPALYCTSADISTDATVPEAPPKICHCCYQEKGDKFDVPRQVSTADVLATRTLALGQPKMACVECSCSHL